MIEQFMLTILNCIALRTFRHFGMLYREVDISIVRNYEKNKGCFTYRLDPYVPVNIAMGKFDSKIKFDTALLHEIGHLIDFKKNINKTYFRRNVNKTRFEKVAEKNAWRECLVLSEKYGVSICYQTARKWLSSYRASYKRLDNLAANMIE